MGTIVAKVLVTLGKAVQQSEAARQRTLVQSFPGNQSWAATSPVATQRRQLYGGRGQKPG